jgi:Glycosyltransferase family 10 (fucosyltransferase) C-term
MTPTWSVERTIEQLQDNHAPVKQSALSWVTSNIGFLSGHRYRMQFLERMRGAIEFDLYGRGFMPLADKWDGLAPYRYSIAFENFRNATYFSEKLMDCIVTETLPLYYGCREIQRHLPAKAVWPFDPEDGHVLGKISDVINSGAWQESLDDLREAKHLVLTKHNMFITIAELILADTTAPETPREMVINPIFVDFRDV